MFKKLDIKTLGWLFIGLLLLTITTSILDNKRGVNTLKSELFTIDESTLSAVKIKPRILNGQSLELKKTNDQWQVMDNGKAYNGDATAINRLVGQLNGLKPLRLAAQNKDSWEKYELTDSMATQVQFVGAKGTLATLYIGKFSYSQPKTNPAMQQNPYARPQGSMTTYVRYDNEKEVYAVEGFLGSLANRDANAFKDKTLIKVNKNDIQKIAFTYPADSSFTMEKKEHKWLSNGEMLDSAAVASYLSHIASLKASKITAGKAPNYTHKVQVYLNNGASIEIKAALDEEQAYLMSSETPGCLFKESVSANFKKLYISKSTLIK